MGIELEVEGDLHAADLASLAAQIQRCAQAMLGVAEVPPVVLIGWPDAQQNIPSLTVGGLRDPAGSVSLRIHVGAEQDIVHITEIFTDSIAEYAGVHAITVSPRRDDLGYAFTACVAVAIRNLCGGRVIDAWRFWFDITHGEADSQADALKTDMPHADLKQAARSLCLKLPGYLQSGWDKRQANQ